MKKNNKKGFFLSETMVVITVVAVVLLGVFKLFSSVYTSFNRSEKYNSITAINALSNIQKYYESIGDIDTTDVQTTPYVNLTNSEVYSSEYYTKLKEELNISKIYLINTTLLLQSDELNDFYVTLRTYIKTLKNQNAIVLLVVLNNEEFASTKIVNYSNIKLVGDESDEYAVYIPIGETFEDPGYENWVGEEPIKTWENGKELDTSKTGTYYLHYNFNGYLLRRKVVVSEFITNFYYTGNYQEYEAITDGYYKIELWGASGGDATYGGKGTYASGIIELEKDEKIYVYVGGEGPSNATTTNVGGYNGGGYSGSYEGTNSYGGGGATDVRLVNGLWNDTIGLNSRIMVAAGGAGTTSKITTPILKNGTLIGGEGIFTNSDFEERVPTGATQTSGGIAYVTSNSGVFGYAIQSNPTSWGGGGGGGYYGGGIGNGTTGSGGSSFMSGYAGVNAITSSTDRTHTNNTLHYSNKYFIDGEMQTGINSGNGKAKITFIGSYFEKNNTKFNNVRYIKDCVNSNSVNLTNHWLELQAISNGTNVAYNKNVSSTSTPGNGNNHLALSGLVDGNIEATKWIALSEGLQCVTVDLATTYALDEIAVWHYYTDERSYNNHSLYVSSNNTNWTALIDNVSGVVETPNGIRVSAYD